MNSQADPQVEPEPKREPRFTEAADRALAEHYAKFGQNQTFEQKLNILQGELGVSNFYGGPEEVSAETKVACLEYEWLSLHGLIELVLC